MKSNSEHTILVVDDTETNVDILVEILSGEYEVIVALDGPTALEIATDARPDLILLDVMMPDMDGWEVCTRLKNNDLTADIPIIFVTAKAMIDDEIKGFELGAVDFITKPVSPPIVRQRIRSTLSLKEHSDKLASLSTQLSRYISPQVFESIFKGNSNVVIGSTRKKLTIFFADIVNFTATTERMEPEDMTALLNSYLDCLSSIALKHGGTIDKFIGDAILVFFGDPVSRGIKEDAVACIEMAIEMREALKNLHDEWLDLGVAAPFQVRMGINTGYCTVGNFGSKQRMDYTIIGGQVNVAARLEQNAPPDQILISHETWALVKDDFRCLGRSPIYVKGIAHPIRTYQILDTVSAIGQNGDEHVEEMVWPALTIDADISVAEVHELMQKKKKMFNLVIMDQSWPIGIITKGYLDEILSIETGKALLLNRPISEVIANAPLILDAETGMKEAARQALAREGEQTFDPIIIVKKNDYLGLVAIRCLIQRLLDIDPEITDI